MIDLANAFNAAGYKTTLVAGRLVKRDKSLAENIKFNKIIQYNRISTLRRLMTWSWGTMQILFLVWFKFRKKKLFIVSNPPFSPLLPLFIKNRFSLLIYDVYPDALTEFGIFSINSMVVKFWQKANKLIFPKAERIITLTPGMKSVLEQYAGGKPVEVIPIWTDNQFLHPVKKEKNRFISKHNLSGKFVIMYSGNLGQSHDVEALVDLAAITNDKDIQFVIIGEGGKKEFMLKKISEDGLTNCLMLPFQKPEDMPFSLAAADIAVVTLGKEASKLSVPSKTYNLMSVGATLLCIAGNDSELNHLVDFYKIGKCFRAEQLQEMKNFILDVKLHPENQQTFSSNALKASKDFGPENIQKFL